MPRKLPAWIARRKDGVFVIDPDLAYPTILGLLGIAEKDYTQAAIETAYQCAKQAAQDLILGTELDPRPAMALTLVIEGGGGRKGRWALARFKAGRGVASVTGSRNLVHPTTAKLAYHSIAKRLIAV